jgi:hypothetical protein
VSAASADEALALLRAAHDAEQSFEVALLDHQMPVCDGEELGPDDCAGSGPQGDAIGAADLLKSARR